jgi:hypothetical protein
MDGLLGIEARRGLRSNREIGKEENKEETKNTSESSSAMYMYVMNPDSYVGESEQGGKAVKRH